MYLAHRTGNKSVTQTCDSEEQAYHEVDINKVTPNTTPL